MKKFVVCRVKLGGKYQRQIDTIRSWGFDGVRMERNQKEILGVMMKQVGLDPCYRFLCLLVSRRGEEGKIGGERNNLSPLFRVKQGYLQGSHFARSSQGSHLLKSVR